MHTPANHLRPLILNSSRTFPITTDSGFYYLIKYLRNIFILLLLKVSVDLFFPKDHLHLKNGYRVGKYADATNSRFAVKHRIFFLPHSE